MDDTSFGLMLGICASAFVVLVTVFPIALDAHNEGTRGNGCYNNKTCNDGLECMSIPTRNSICLEPGSIKKAK